MVLPFPPGRKYTLLVLSMAFAASACEPDLKKIDMVTREEKQAQEIARDILIWYSDSARLKVRLEAPHMEKFQGENPYVEFPGGLHVVFYDSLEQPSAELTARYAIRYLNEKRMEARRDVVVVNQKGEKLNTEHLVWDEEQKVIRTDEMVRITTAREVLWGKGMEADQYFKKFRIRNIQGTIPLEENDTLNHGI